MSANPQAFFAFAARYNALLKDVYDASSRGGFNDAALWQMVIQNRSSEDSSTEFIVNQLRKLNIIEECADATSKFTMTMHVSTFLGFLYREHRLTSIYVIQGYLQNMEKNRTELDNAILESNDDLCDLTLTDIAASIEDMRYDSRNNRDALMHEALRLKQNKDKLSTEQRFTIVNRLWESYLNPMKEMIDVKEAMDAQLDALARSLHCGLNKREINISIRDKIRTLFSTLTRMRRNVSSDFRESLRNITPLYESLHRESGLARGAAAALSIAHKKGVEALGINGRIRLPVFRINNLMDCPSLLDYLYQLVEQDDQGEAHKIPLDIPVKHPYYLSPGAAVKRLLSELPVSDAFVWLSHAYVDAGITDILRAYNQIIRLNHVQHAFSEERTRKIIGGFEVHYSPLHIQHQEMQHE